MQKGAKIEPSSIDFSDTLLHVAAAHGKTEILQALIDFGVQLDAENAAYLTPLHMAIREGHLKAVQLLWSFYNEGLSEERKRELLIGREQRNDQDNFLSVTMHAVRNGSIEIVRFHISQGARLDTLVGSLVLEACKEGDLDLVKFLVEAGAPLEIPFGNALLEACNRRNLDLVHYLVLEKKVDVNAQVCVVNGKCSPEPVTPIFAAIDDSAIFFFLLKHGADPSAAVVFDGYTLMHVFAFCSGDYSESLSIFLDMIMLLSMHWMVSKACLFILLLSTGIFA